MMEYAAPATLANALALAHQTDGQVRFLAGGTDVLVQLRSGLFTPDLVIDVKQIPGMLDVTRSPEGTWTIGAAVPGRILGTIEGLRDDWPGVVEAMELIGSTQIQSRASLVGNLCNASPAADSIPAMVAAGATVSIAGADGQRTAEVADILVAPGQTNLKKGEIVTSIDLPARLAGSADAYLRFIPRTEMDIAVAGCAVNLTVKDSQVCTARVSLGAVAPTVLLVPDAAAAICGTRLEETALNDLAAACRAACRPIDDKRGTVAFRTDIAGILARRAAILAYRRAQERESA